MEISKYYVPLFYSFDSMKLFFYFLLNVLVTVIYSLLRVTCTRFTQCAQVHYVRMKIGMSKSWVICAAPTAGEVIVQNIHR